MSWYFEEISKFDKYLYRLNKRQKENIQFNKIRGYKGDMVIDSGNSENEKNML